MDKLNVEESIKETEHNLNKALESNNAVIISGLLSDDWTILESSTGLSSKKQFLSAIQNGTLIHEQMTKAIVHVKINDQFAIVVSKGINKGKYLDRVFNAENWVTNIYFFSDNKWLCSMTTEIPVSC